MKLVTYQIDGGAPQLGALKGDDVLNLADASAGRLPNTMRGFLEMGDDGMEIARSMEAPTDAKIALDTVKLMAPILDPSKIVAIGLNYIDHIRETNSPTPEIPIMFTKFTSAIVGPGDEVRWSRALTSQVDWEVELAVIIGKSAYRVAEADALDYVAGYTICNDVSARDIQINKGDQWIRGKSLDTFCPLGPYLVTKDEIADPHNLDLKTTVNGQVMQDSNTKELLFKIPYLIHYLSQAFTLLPGDLIITGTPPGVGMGMNPPVYLKNGDTMTVEIEGLGSLTNVCVSRD